ncbi:MAG: radical SAM protein [Candidatus Omnitrophota bacterium]
MRQKIMLNEFMKSQINNNYSPAKAAEVDASGAAIDKNMVKPEFVCLGITDSCMLRCKMCYKWEEDIFIKKTQQVPTVEQYKNFLKGLRQLVDDNFVVNFGGGEPLLFDRIFEIIAYAVQLGFRTNLNSNGFLINKDNAIRFYEAGLHDIKLSLDSLDKKVHDYLRGVDGVFDQLMLAIDNLARYAPGIEISLISVIYEHNYRKFIQLIKWINRHEKIRHVLIMAPMQPNNTYPEDRWWEGKYSFLWPRDTKAVCSLMDELIEMKKEGYRINNTIGQLRAAKDYFICPEKFVKKTHCNMYKAIHVSSIGQVYICFNYDIIGNIKSNDDIKKILCSNKTQKVRDKIKNCRKNCHFLINCFFEEDSDDKGH